MDFKVKLFNSEHLNEIDTRRIKIDLQYFKLHDFLTYLKSLHDIGDAEIIFVCWKDTSKWNFLKSEADWNVFLEKCINDSKCIIKLNIYYGNVHINITCDICGNIVVGDRHKCLQCDDFDICQVCFQTKPNIHKQHCLLLLRTPEDSIKYLRSIPSPFGMSDFRVVDIDLDRMCTNITRNCAETQTNVNATAASFQTDGPDPGIAGTSAGVKVTQIDNHGEVKVVEMDNCTETKDVHVDNCSSIPQDYLDRLPSNILEGLTILKSMGFANMDGPMIALLIEKNGNICEVIEELEYSLKKK